MLNKVILMGRLTRDPELRYTQNNTPVCSFSIAVDRNYSGNGEKQTDFIDIVTWRKTAEFVVQWFTKGQLIIVDGSLQSRRWQDKNGNNRTSIEVAANEVQFGETRRARESGGSAGGPVSTAPVSRSGTPGERENRPLPAYHSGFDELADDGEVPF